jgi:hypothetical protein
MVLVPITPVPWRSLPVRLNALLIAVATLTVACAPGPGTDHAQSLVITEAPSRYAVNQSATGPLTSASSAAQVTTASAQDTQPELDSNSFAGGYARVWTTNAGFLTVIALDFKAVRGASAFQDFEVKALRDSGTVYLTDDSAIPGASVYVLTGPTHAGGSEVFCNGVWMSVGITVLDTVTCSQTPASAATAEAIALQEYQLARRINEPG